MIDRGPHTVVRCNVHKRLSQISWFIALHIRALMVCITRNTRELFAYNRPSTEDSNDNIKETQILTLLQQI